MDGDEIIAVVGHKTFEGLLSDLGAVPLLHQRLLELGAHEHHALVVEAPYEHFVGSRRVHHYTASYCGAVIANLYAAHPGLRIVSCANPKTANAWTRSFFAAVWALVKSGEA